MAEFAQFSRYMASKSPQPNQQNRFHNLMYSFQILSRSVPYVYRRFITLFIISLNVLNRYEFVKKSIKIV